MLKLGNDDYMKWKQFEGRMRLQKVNLEDLRKMIEKPIPQYLKENMIQQFSREFLKYEISKDWMQQFDKANEFVEECLYLIQTATNAVRPTNGKDIVKSVLKDLKSEYFLNLTIKDYADRYHIHPNHLVRLFKQEMESTFYQTLVEIRMKKAEQALTQTDLKIIEIAVEVGYYDPGYFAQVFRKYHHMTPNEYRKRLQDC